MSRGVGDWTKEEQGSVGLWIFLNRADKISEWIEFKV